jgi:hypothetical protein
MESRLRDTARGLRSELQFHGRRREREHQSPQHPNVQGPRGVVGRRSRLGQGRTEVRVRIGHDRWRDWPRHLERPLGQVAVCGDVGGAEELIGASHGVDGRCECSWTVCDEMLHTTPHRSAGTGPSNGRFRRERYSITTHFANCRRWLAPAPRTPRDLRTIRFLRRTIQFYDGYAIDLYELIRALYLVRMRMIRSPPARAIRSDEIAVVSRAERKPSRDRPSSRRRFHTALSWRKNSQASYLEGFECRRWTHNRANA